MYSKLLPVEFCNKFHAALRPLFWVSYSSHKHLCFLLLHSNLAAIWAVSPFSTIHTEFSLNLISKMEKYIIQRSHEVHSSKTLVSIVLVTDPLPGHSVGHITTHYTWNISHYILHITHCTLLIIHNTLHITHYILHIIRYTLNIIHHIFFITHYHTDCHCSLASPPPLAKSLTDHRKPNCSWVIPVLGALTVWHWKIPLPLYDHGRYPGIIITANQASTDLWKHQGMKILNNILNLSAR